jgi:Flp pilus assembly pilin Flp
VAGVGGVGLCDGRPVRLPDLPAPSSRTLTCLADERGQDVVEYGLLIATVAIVVLLAVTAFGWQIEGWFSLLASHITTT